MVSSTGVDLGRITNVVVDERGQVVEYRVRRGVLGWFKPTHKVRPGELGTFGGETAIVAEQPRPSTSHGERDSG